ncbi:MAG: glucan biosynthesis protein G [Pseudomonadota bacterium]
MINRRHFIAAMASTAAVHLSPTTGRSETSDLLEYARRLGQNAYSPSTSQLQAPFADLDYDAYRGIRPKPGRAAMLPLGERYAFDLLPPGLYFPDPVAIDIMRPSGPEQVAFSPGLFSFEPRYFDAIPDRSPGADFSGLRLRYPLNAADVLDEVMVAQGGSYFRAIGQSMVYGLSARAVAIGTGGADPEEFPRFIQMRLHEPAGDVVRLEAVIDSPSLAGHFDMRLRPGADTTAEITTTLFPRTVIDDVGIAPLTSMFLKGPIRASTSDDFRPRVHDSDVLFVHNGADEMLWRPITNPAQLQTSSFIDDGPAGFGLFQSARSFEDYEDTEARYHDRPSGFVQPLGDWGAGAVVLVEIPTADEFLDNIVAFWRPEAALLPGESYQYDYRLTWTLNLPNTGGVASVLQSRSGREHDQPGARRYVVDVDTQQRDAVPVISASEGAEIDGVSAFALPDERGTRVTFLMRPPPADSAEIRLSLRGTDNTPLSPVWLHRWTRARDGGV